MLCGPLLGGSFVLLLVLLLVLLILLERAITSCPIVERLDSYSTRTLLYCTPRTVAALVVFAEAYHRIHFVYRVLC